jgi:leucyl-tRNA synthetase
MEYKPRAIEQKWLANWKKNETYKVKTGGTKPKFYILDMFPYPSGAGLHVGHPLGYIASDILSRFKRLQGYNVLHPMGFDAFGLPAEQYALENGIHPEVSTRTNINRYREQLDNLALSFDWSREVSTCDPEFYKWTQWIFLQMFDSWYSLDADKALNINELVTIFEKEGNEKVRAANNQETTFSAADWTNFSKKEQADVLMNYRLMYRKISYVNWCETLGTVLANDEITNGVSERGGHPVTQKPMLQWSMRTTAYAERLLNGLETVDFPDSLKAMQRAWVGKSEGATVFFQLDGHDAQLEIFTTRADTIFGATFMVIAPEHDLVAEITTENCRKEVEKYLEWVKTRSEIERMSDKQVTGAFTGAHVIHPFSGEKVPVFISEYVLKSYGTGAIMAVPADDERDQKFAEKFGLKIQPVVDKSDYPGATLDEKVGKIINSDFLNGLEVKQAIQKMNEKIEENGIGKRRINYKIRDAGYARQRYWGEPVPIIYDKNEVAFPLLEADLPLELPDLTDFTPAGGGKGPLAKLTDWVNLNDGRTRETDTMPGFAGSSWYFLRYMDPRNKTAFASKEALDYWQDVDFYIGGAEHAVGHLMYSRMWHKFLFDLDLVPTDEPYKKLVNQGMIQGRSNFVYRATERFFEEFLQKKVLEPFLSAYLPIRNETKRSKSADFEFKNADLVIEVKSNRQKKVLEEIQKNAQSQGKRLLILSTEGLIEQINEPHLIAQIIEKTLQNDVKYTIWGEKNAHEKLFVSFDLTEKYSSAALTKLHVDVNIVDGDVLILEKTASANMFKNANFKLNANKKFWCSWEIEKMSKSKYNVVNPDDIINQFGADCFRMYEMFLGPIEQGKPWDTKGITGVSGFLRKFWAQFFDEKTGDFHLETAEPNKDEMRILHAAIKRVTEDIERFSMNTCVSHFMIATNELRKINCSKRAILEPLVVLLAPFAPHLAEEIWEKMGHKTSVCDAKWPNFDENWLKTDSINYPIQINGKLRANIELPADADAKTVEAAVLALEQVQKYMEGKPLRKFIFVAGRMANVVV